MGLRPFRSIPKSIVEWSSFFQQQVVTPDPGTVTDETFAQRAPNSVIGRAASTAGPPSDIVSPGNGRFLVERGDALVFDTLTDGDVPAGIARDTEVASAIATHEAAPDPHPQYLTQIEGDARYRELSDAVTYAEITGKPAVFGLLYTGTGSPESVVTAGVGSMYLRTDGGANTTLYIKESGVSNTGWIAK